MGNSDEQLEHENNILFVIWRKESISLGYGHAILDKMGFNNSSSRLWQGFVDPPRVTGTGTCGYGYGYRFSYPSALKRAKDHPNWLRID